MISAAQLEPIDQRVVRYIVKTMYQDEIYPYVVHWVQTIVALEGLIATRCLVVKNMSKPTVSGRDALGDGCIEEMDDMPDELSHRVLKLHRAHSVNPFLLLCVLL